VNPLMTENGTFVINGYRACNRFPAGTAARACFFDHDRGKTTSSGSCLYLRPRRDSLPWVPWLDFEF